MRSIVWTAAALSALGSLVLGAVLLLDIGHGIERIEKNIQPATTKARTTMNGTKSDTWDCTFNGHPTRHTVTTVRGEFDPDESQDAFCKRHAAAIKSDMLIWIPIQ